MSHDFAWYGGIDFSGAREPLSNLWTALGREEDGRLLICSLRPHAFRADLRAYVADGWRASLDAAPDERTIWGVDFPFGLPAAAAAHLTGGTAPSWERLLAWVADRPAEEVKDAVPPELRGPRVTDTGGAMAPFDLRLLKQTVEGIRWLHELRESMEISVLPHDPVAGSGTTLVEVYPSGTVQELGLPRRRSPRRPGETRARAAALRTFVRFETAELEAIAVNLEDAWDASIACITAFLARHDLDQPRRAGACDESTLRLEGWIYRPPETVG